MSSFQLPEHIRDLYTLNCRRQAVYLDEFQKLSGSCPHGSQFKPESTRYQGYKSDHSKNSRIGFVLTKMKDLQWSVSKSYWRKGGEIDPGPYKSPHHLNHILGLADSYLCLGPIKVSGGKHQLAGRNNASSYCSSSSLWFHLSLGLLRGTIGQWAQCLSVPHWLLKLKSVDYKGIGSLKEVCRQKCGIETRVPLPKALAKAVGMFRRDKHDSFLWGFWEKGLRKDVVF